MAAPPRFRVVLAKEDFKFSAAHFTVFTDGQAELLHGHNYQVRVSLAGSQLDEHGLLVDLDAVKRLIRHLCAGLDGRTLVPESSPLVELRQDGSELEVRFGRRRYLLPSAEVELLPLANTSIELLARHLWQRIASELEDPRVDWMAVSVAETQGQSCVYESEL